MKNRFFGRFIKTPYILCAGHRYPYQMENAIKVVGIVFSKYHLS